MKLTEKELIRAFDEYENLSVVEVNDIMAYLNGLKTDDLGSVLGAYQEISADIAQIKDEIKVLKEEEAGAEAHLEMLSEAIQKAMERESVTSCTAGDYEATVKESKASNIVNEADIPTVYIKSKVTTSINKSAILEALKNGESVPGAELVVNKKLTVKGV